VKYFSADVCGKVTLSGGDSNSDDNNSDRGGDLLHKKILIVCSGSISS